MRIENALFSTKGEFWSEIYIIHGIANRDAFLVRIPL